MLIGVRFFERGVILILVSPPHLEIKIAHTRIALAPFFDETHHMISERSELPNAHT